MQQHFKKVIFKTIIFVGDGSNITLRNIAKWWQAFATLSVLATALTAAGHAIQVGPMLARKKEVCKNIMACF